MQNATSEQLLKEVRNYIDSNQLKEAYTAMYTECRQLMLNKLGVRCTEFENETNLLRIVNLGDMRIMYPFISLLSELTLIRREIESNDVPEDFVEVYSEFIEDYYTDFCGVVNTLVS